MLTKIIEVLPRICDEYSGKITKFQFSGNDYRPHTPGQENVGILSPVYPALNLSARLNVFVLVAWTLIKLVMGTNFSRANKLSVLQTRLTPHIICQFFW